MQVQQLIAKLQLLNPTANVEGFAHDNATTCIFDYEHAVQYEQDERTDFVNKDIVVLHFNVDTPTVK